MLDAPLFLFFVFFALLMGLAFGSFGNVLLMRVAQQRPLTGRSACPQCGKEIVWHDLFPVLSFLWLRGKCRACKRKISLQYPVIELASSVLFLVAFLMEQSFLAIPLALIFWGLLLISIYDAQTQTIPDLFTSFIFIGAGMWMIFTGNLMGGALGLLIGCAWFAAQWIVSNGRFVGTGDILLAGSLGLWLGAINTVVMLFAAYIIGASFALYLIVQHKVSHKSHLAFGPFLALGAVLAYLGIGDWYVRLIGF